MNRHRAAAFAFGFLLFASSAFAVHREVTTVEVVQVPVYVSAHGHAITGLTRSDFEVYVNGKPQPVDYFDVIDFASLPPEAAADPRQRRLYVLTFDLVFSSLNTLRRAQSAALHYLDNALPSDVFAVATYTSNKGLRFIVPFTRDRALLHTALRRLNQIQSGDPLQLTLSSRMRPEQAEPDRGGNAFQPSSEIRAVFTVQQAARESALQPYGFVAEDQVGALTDLSDRLAMLEGQKHVVFFSAGFNDSLIHGVWSNPHYSTIGTGPIPPNYFLHGAPDRFEFMSAGDPRLGGEIKKLAAHYTAAGVFLDAIDVVGLRLMQTSTDNESLFTLTRDTGGTVMEHDNNLTRAVQALTDKQRVVYVLGFKPSARGRARNSIRVKVRNVPSSADIVYRPSFSREIPVPASNDGLHLSDILLNDIPQSGLSLVADTTSTSAGHVVVNVDLPTRELLAVSENKNVDAEALLYIYSGNSVVAFQQKHISLDADRIDRDKPVRISQEFALPSGHYAAKVLIRDEEQLGFVRSDFTVGE